LLKAVLTKFELNKPGVRSMLQSADARRICEQVAREIANRAGEGFEVDSAIGRTRARASVFTATSSARRRQAKEHTLQKSLR
jgi:hypothetical protein